MSTIENKPYSSPQNINLKGGILRFNVTNASNPLGDESYGLYVNGSGELIFRSTTSSTTLGASGGGSTAPSLDAIYAGDQSLAITAGSLTMAGAHASNDVIVVTNASGSGDCIQITNSGTGNDIEGTSDTWHFTKAGDFTANMGVMAGDAGSDSLTLTAGDVVFSDGSVTITDADNAATFTVTNNTATTASVFVLAGSGVFTGSTTTSFLTITPSGMTTGTAVYLPVAAMTTGAGLQVVANAVTSGSAVLIESSATGITSTTGGLLKVTHSGTGSTSGVIVGITTAATDETIAFDVTASAALAAGALVNLSASSMTTGWGISLDDLDALTTGKGISISSAATAIATTGRLLYVLHSGATSTSGVLTEFNSAATDETTIVKITASGALALGACLDIVASSLTTGVGLRIDNADALTTGVLVDIESAATAITGAGRMLSVDHSGATSTSGILVEFKSAATDETDILKITATGALALGSCIDIVASSMTTGAGLRIDSADALTDGILVDLESGATAMTSTGRMLKVDHSGNASVSGIIAEFASAAADETTIVKITASAALALGACLDIVASSMTTGVGLRIDSADALTTGVLVDIESAATAIATTGRMLSVDHSGATTTSGILSEFKSAATDETTIVKITASAALALGTALDINVSAMTTGTALKITATEGTLSGGLYINCYDATSSKTVFSVAENGAIIYSETTETVAATNTITADESGKTFFLGHATEFVTTLPAPTAGLNFKFFVSLAPSGASYTIVTHDGSDLIYGMAVSSADAGGSADSTAGTAADTITFVDGQAAIGDYVQLSCDGTYWYAVAVMGDEDAITYTAT